MRFRSAKTPDTSGFPVSRLVLDKSSVWQVDVRRVNDIVTAAGEPNSFNWTQNKQTSGSLLKQAWHMHRSQGTEHVMGRRSPEARFEALDVSTTRYVRS